MQTEGQSRREKAARNQRSRSAVVARLLAVLYLFASLVAALHHHDLPALNAFGGPAKTPAQAASFASAAHAAPHTLAVSSAAPLQSGDRDCAVCDFIAHLVSPAQYVTLPPSLTVADNLPAPQPRPTLHFPRRFCDRSSARAPPVA